MSVTSFLRRHLVATAIFALAAGGVLVAPIGAAGAAPAPATCANTVVRSAELVQTTEGPVILVRGVASNYNPRLQLVPEDVVFIQQPDYFPYQVQECAVTQPTGKFSYTRVFAVPTSPVGRFGIQIGPSQINLPGLGGPELA